MNIIQVLFLILLWVIPIFLIINTYLKLDQDEQQSLKKEIKTPSFLLTGGLGCIGVLIFSTGGIATIKILQHIGAFMVFFGLFSGCIATWKRSWIKSVSFLSLGVIGLAVYRFLN